MKVSEEKVKFIDPNETFHEQQRKIGHIDIYFYPGSVEITEKGGILMKPRIQALLDPHFTRALDKSESLKAWFWSEIGESIKHYHLSPSEFDLGLKPDPETEAGEVLTKYGYVIAQAKQWLDENPNEDEDSKLAFKTIVEMGTVLLAKYKEERKSEMHSHDREAEGEGEICE